jgi:hypothetical protein
MYLHGGRVRLATTNGKGMLLITSPRLLCPMQVEAAKNRVKVVTDVVALEHFLKTPSVALSSLGRFTRLELGRNRVTVAACVTRK